MSTGFRSQVPGSGVRRRRRFSQPYTKTRTRHPTPDTRHLITYPPSLCWRGRRFPQTCPRPALHVRRAQHRDGGVEHHDHDQPSHGGQRQRLHDKRRDQYRRQSADRQADRRPKAVRVGTKESSARHRHEKSGRSHHDRNRRGLQRSVRLRRLKPPLGRLSVNRRSRRRLGDSQFRRAASSLVVTNAPGLHQI